MDVDAAARAWADGWRRAWETRDADLVATLYTGDAVFRSHPFREPHRGAAGARAYAVGAFADTEGVPDVRFGEPVVIAGDRAVVEYWTVDVEHGERVTIAGVSLLRFRDDGLVAEQRDYWNHVQGAHEPHPEWGR